jgi:hypothetical protein
MARAGRARHLPPARMDEGREAGEGRRRVMKYKVTLAFEVEVDPTTDDALIAQEERIETAAIQMVEEYLENGAYADRVDELQHRAVQVGTDD